jgi:hypothetical protein
MKEKNYENQISEIVDGGPASMRSCKSCVHNMVCEARRTLYRSLVQFDNEFGDMVDIGVIHYRKEWCVDLLAKSCKHYLSSKMDGYPGRTLEELK